MIGYIEKFRILKIEKITEKKKKLQEQLGIN